MSVPKDDLQKVREMAEDPETAPGFQLLARVAVGLAADIAPPESDYVSFADERIGVNRVGKGLSMAELPDALDEVSLKYSGEVRSATLTASNALRRLLTLAAATLLLLACAPYVSGSPLCDWRGLDATSRAQLCQPERDYACDWDVTPTTRHLHGKTFDFYESHFCDAAVCGGVGGSNACAGNGTFPTMGAAVAWIGEHPEGGHRAVLTFAGTREVRIGNAP